MIKQFGIIKRKDGLTREQCLRHWKEIHAPMFVLKNAPGLRKYAQNHVIEATGRGIATDIDGIVELWFDDIESAETFRQWLNSSDETKDLREDTKLFVNLKESPIVIAEEHIIKEC